MDNFNAHKWFKKEYLGEGHTDDKVVAATKDGRIEITQKQMERLHNGEVVHLSNGSVLSFVKEGHTEDKMERDQAIKRYDQLSDDDKLKLAKIQAMMDKERSLKEDNIEENRLYPDYDDIIELIKGKTVKNNSSEIDEAMEAMEFIGQHYGINFEFGRG